MKVKKEPFQKIHFHSSRKCKQINKKNHENEASMSTPNVHLILLDVPKNYVILFMIIMLDQ